MERAMAKEDGRVKAPRRRFAAIEAADGMILLPLNADNTVQIERLNRLKSKEYRWGPR